MTGDLRQVGRVKDRWVNVVDEWHGGCLWCGSPDARVLPGLEEVGVVFCRRHVRWAMASRREGMGKQSYILRRLLLAWCRRRGGDPEVVKQWLGRGR